MTVGREISPECSTDDRREWQNGAAALAISSRRPTGWLGSRMIRSMYASGSSPVAAASCRTCSLARLAAPLGRTRPFSTVSVHRAIAVDRKPRAVRSVSGSLVPQYGTASTIQHSMVGGWRGRFTRLEYLTTPKILFDFFCPAPHFRVAKLRGQGEVQSAGARHAPHRNLGIGLHHIPGASGFPGCAPGAGG